jgi:hypothetical protein
MRLRGLTFSKCWYFLDYQYAPVKIFSKSWGSDWDQEIIVEAYWDLSAHRGVMWVLYGMPQTPPPQGFWQKSELPPPEFSTMSK